MSVWIDPKDVEQQHRESLSYLGQRHKDRTERIPRDSATTKDQNGNVLRVVRSTQLWGHFCGLLIVLPNL